MIHIKNDITVSNFLLNYQLILSFRHAREINEGAFMESARG